MFSQEKDLNGNSLTQPIVLEPKLYASWIKLRSLKCPSHSLLSVLPFCISWSTVKWSTVFLKLPLRWSRGNMPWFVMHQIYSMCCIADSSLATRIMKMCLYFGELPLGFIRATQQSPQNSTINYLLPFLFPFFSVLNYEFWLKLNRLKLSKMRIPIVETLQIR